MKKKTSNFCLLMVALLALMQVASPMVHAHVAYSDSANDGYKVHLHAGLHDEAAELHQDEGRAFHHSGHDAVYNLDSAIVGKHVALNLKTSPAKSPFLLVSPVTSTSMMVVDVYPALPPPVALHDYYASSGFDAQAPPLV